MNEDDLARLFMPNAMRGHDDVATGKRLVHYTTAEAAYKIVTTRRVWLRHVHLMNDYSEMRHGLTCLQRGWQSDAGQTLQTWIDANWPGMKAEIEGLFDAHAHALTNQTYITSLSVHEDEEDQYGRLSMWRAYGKRSGVALVLNTTAFLSDTGALKVYSVPVTYLDEPGFLDWFAGWVAQLVAAQDQLLALDRAEVIGQFFWAFRIIVLATKHPGFAEEREWRVFHSPALEGVSDWVTYDTEVIGGVPQPVVKVHLRDDEDAGVLGVAPSQLINRVIIGPCENPIPIKSAFWAALEGVDVPDPEERIWMSFIPLRHRD